MSAVKGWILFSLVAAAVFPATSVAGGRSAATPFGARGPVPRLGFAALDPPPESAAPDSVSPDASAAGAAATTPPEAAPVASFSATVATYIVPHTRVYAQPTLTVDYEWLHLEGRYNYESYDTASLWLGGNFSIGEKLTLDFTPMVGGVFGDVTGVAPGVKLTLGFWKLDLYSEAEYFFDTDDHTGNFGYAWSELGLTPMEWLRFGLVGQRTNAYDTEVDIQRGLFAGLAYRWLSFTTYVFNLDQSEQTVVLSVGVSM